MLDASIKNHLIEIGDFEQIEIAYGASMLNLDFDANSFADQVSGLFALIRDLQSDCEQSVSQYWRKTYQHLRSLDKSVPETELKLATSLVFDYCIVLLACSKDAFYNFEMAEVLRSVEEQNNPEALDERIERLIVLAEPHEQELSAWIDDFMEMGEDADAEGGLKPSAKASPKPAIPRLAGRQWPKVFIKGNMPISQISEAIRTAFGSLFDTDEVALVDGIQFTRKDFVIALYFVLVKLEFSPVKVNVSAYRDFMASTLGADQVLTVQAYAPVFRRQTVYQRGLHQLTETIVQAKAGNEQFMSADDWRYWTTRMDALELYLRRFAYFSSFFV